MKIQRPKLLLFNHCNVVKLLHLVQTATKLLAMQSNAQRGLKVADKLRRAEILLNSEMPVIGYDETGRLSATILKLLEVRFSATEEEDQKLDLRKGFAAELQRLEQFRELAARNPSAQELPWALLRN